MLLEGAAVDCRKQCEREHVSMLLLMLQLSTAQLLLMLGMNHLYQFGHAPQRIRYLYEQCAGAGAVTKYVSIAGDSRVSTRGRRHCSTYLPVVTTCVRRGC